MPAEVTLLPAGSPEAAVAAVTDKGAAAPEAWAGAYANTLLRRHAMAFSAGNTGMPASVLPAGSGQGNWWDRTFTLKSKPGVTAPKFWDDVTFSGLPLVGAGLLVRGERHAFRQDYNNPTGRRARFITDFKTHIDDYTQLVPFALATTLNLAGYEGRHTLPRYAASTAMSFAIMAAIVNPIKYSFKEMRPDGSTANSFPSGHTATAFVAATILHKEYGLTRSPWFSIGGYAMATATGIMRVLNNRHWVSDIFAGAGIGILSTELAYGLGDLIFRDKGINRGELEGNGNVINNPTFFSLSMGMGFGTRNLSFDAEALGMVAGEDPRIDLKFRPATVVGVESAYFFNKYFGLGGRFRVASNPIGGWDNLFNRTQEGLKESADLFDYMGESDLAESFANMQLTLESDHLTEFTADAGVYLNLPLSNRLALGTKFLVGRSIYQSLAVSATATGKTLALNPDAAAELETGPSTTESLLIPTGGTYDETWDYLAVSANNSMKLGTGLSLTYAYKSNFAWRLFADYDYSRKRYTMEVADERLLSVIAPSLFAGNVQPLYTQTIKKNSNRFTVGASLMISF